MQETVLFHEQRSVGSFSDCGGNNLVAESDETRFASDHRAPGAAVAQRQDVGWMRRIARAFVSKTNAKAQLRPSADDGIHELSKGWTKRTYFADGGTVSCRAGKVWITLDEGGEDIVLTACESKSFDPGARVLVEALAESRVVLEAL
jgi:Protein of unknown function (DUF2917)